MTKPIGILGGTFDPVHHGHLRMAIECLDSLALAEVRLVPLYSPPHRRAPQATPEHRLAMLKIAVGTMDNLKVEDYELRRQGISYTIDTVSALRKNFGNTPICLLMGMDAFYTLHTWHRWQSLLDYVHIVVTERPGVAFVPEHAELKDLLSNHNVTDATVLNTTKCGSIFHLQIPWLDISATRIRGMLRMHQNPAFLLPAAVIDYIQTHRLYAGA
jgi:nicotinate-nucleotide adenylyltransferase